MPESIEVCFTGNENVKPISLFLPFSRRKLPPSLATKFDRRAAIKSNSSCSAEIVASGIKLLNGVEPNILKEDKLREKEAMKSAGYLGCTMHDFFGDRHLLGLAVDDTLIFSSQLHPQHSEVGASKIQGVEQPSLIPTSRLSYQFELN
jgi:hypothetical protein